MTEQGYQDPTAALREEMVRKTLLTRDIASPEVLEAMRRVKRHLFVPDAVPESAYGDHPLQIGYQQTISQPYIVAYMAQAAKLKAHMRVLEIGTGSGYGAAVLAELVAEVFTVEIHPELAQTAAERLTSLGYQNVHVRCADGTLGWPEQQPFDAIIVTAAPPCLPPSLQSQLAPGGRLVIPVGKRHHQELLVLEKTADSFQTSRAFPVRFVPMIGEIQRLSSR